MGISDTLKTLLEEAHTESKFFINMNFLALYFNETFEFNQSSDRLTGALAGFATNQEIDGF